MAGFSYHWISDRKLAQRSPASLAAEAEERGITYFQLREKDLSQRELLLAAHSVRKVLKRTRMIVNGNLAIALLAGADGVHLQSDGVPVAAVREQFPEWIIGYSAHSREELMAAGKDGADYVFVSPVFQPRSKPATLPALGIERLSQWVADSPVPVIALGGITRENLEQIKASGSSGAAAISLFLDASL